MPQMIFVNLPIADIARSRAFYAALGFDFDPRFQDDRSACVVIADNIHFMMMETARFAGFAPKPVADTQATTGVLLALSRDSREAVDAMMAAAVANGGTDTGKLQEMGDYMYFRSFCDPDGHVIVAGWMDVDAAMKDWGQAG